MTEEHPVTDAVLGKYLRAYKKDTGGKPLYVPLEEVERMMREVESAATTLLAEKIKARLESGKSYRLSEDIQEILEGAPAEGRRYHHHFEITPEGPLSPCVFCGKRLYDNVRCTGPKEEHDGQA